jgi:hypothetical protein
VLVAAGAAAHPGVAAALEQVDPAAPFLLFEWRPDGGARDLAADADRLARLVSGPVELAVCSHGGGPPRCWCRPPLPGSPSSSGAPTGSTSRTRR